MARRPRRSSVRDRRINATGPDPTGRLPSAAEGPRQHEVVLSGDGQPRDARRPQFPAERRVHLSRQRGRQNLPVHPERDIAARDLLQLRRQRVVEQEPDAHRAEDLRLRQTDQNRDRHQLQHAVRLRQQAEAFLAPERIAHRRLAGDDECRLRGRADRGEHRAGSVRDEQKVRLQLILIAAGDVLNRRRIVRVDGGLHLGRVGDEPRHLHERLCPRRPQLIDERRRRHHLALERLFGFTR